MADLGRIAKRAGGGFLGRNVGGVIGQAIIPVPGLGFLVGAAVGGFFGSGGNLLSAIPFAGVFGDAAGAAGDVFGSAASEVAGSVASDVGTSAAADIATSSVAEVGTTTIATEVGTNTIASASYVDPSLVSDPASSYGDAATNVTSSSSGHFTSQVSADSGGTDIHGNPTDGTIHGGRPTDIQGNENGRTVWGTVPTDILGNPRPA